MPEGDTIFRAARTLARALCGRTITRFESVFPQLNRVDEDAPLRGRTVTGVEAVGKHLLIRFSENLTLRTHMRMKGSWHIYRPGETWRRSSRNAKIILETDAYIAVGFSIPIAEMVPTDREGSDRELRRLGPDPLKDDFDSDLAAERLRAKRTSLIADALLNQTVMAGVGNVYKSEVLFLCRIHPRRTVQELSESEIGSLIETAADLLRQNVSSASRRPGERRTTRRLTPGEGLWVYGRGGEPCRRCGTGVARSLIGTDARVTYWCPSCQPR